VSADAVVWTRTSQEVPSALNLDICYVAHVPYRGAVLADAISGRVTMTLQNMGAILPVVRDGKLRGLAVTLKRSLIISELPTLAEWHRAR
jgi:tripartite-type tricarboxylate transporter receptor subunit TctC